jgi:hypothetical protein
MTAYDLYQLFVGEIGIPRHEFLYELQYWELVKIAKGYQARSRNMWSAIRWQTFTLMNVQVGGKEMRSKRIFTPKDLLPFPWDNKEAASPLSEADRQELQDLIDNERKKKL